MEAGRNARIYSDYIAVAISASLHLWLLRCPTNHIKPNPIFPLNMARFILAFQSVQSNDYSVILRLMRMFKSSATLIIE